MNLKLGQTISNFTINDKEEIDEIEGVAYTLEHNVSKAKLLYLQNEDNNKAFSIAFKTPPANDTGVFHILEHSVLCGSKKFPVKEPFVNLLKGSMQTFLNAMTFSDKTLYPVASTNEKDLMNLTSVYMDAVLHPNIYSKPEIFEQEGWHKEIVDGEGNENNKPKLTYNGVVYNEMKGALSDPASVLYSELEAKLFPNTPYAFESGGTPAGIPYLTYQEFLDEHARHYRLDNSYIVLYGNLNIENMLKFLDEEYLTPVSLEQKAHDEKRKSEGKEALLPRTLPLQAPTLNLFTKREMHTSPENSCMAAGYVIGKAVDRRKILATDILLDAIAGSNEAPLKRALLNANLAGDVSAYIADSVQQPFAVISIRNLNEGAQNKFLRTVNEELRYMQKTGVDRSLVEASLSHAEFVAREADFGIADGVAYSMASLCGWLYSDNHATSYLKYEADFAFLREMLDTTYFTDLLASVFLNNNHMCTVEIVPTENEAANEVDALNTQAQSYTEADFTAIAQSVEKLRKHQEAPDTPEALATLPKLGVADIEGAPKRPAYTHDATGAYNILLHSASTHGLAYATLYFNANCITFDELPYLGVLKHVLGRLETAKHSPSELDTLTNGKLGNLTFMCNVYGSETDVGKTQLKFSAASSSLGGNVQHLASLPLEVLLETKFSDTKRIYDVLNQVKIGMEQSFMNAGHSAACARANSYCKAQAQVQQQLSGVDFYRFIKHLLTNFDSEKAALTEKLEQLSKRLFSLENLTLSFAGESELLQTYKTQLESTFDACGSVESTNEQTALKIPAPKCKNEAFIVPTDVCFAAVCADRRELSHEPYNGIWQIASQALSFDYLWNEVRVKGGAYGAGFQAALNGNMRFYSFRDPHLQDTLTRISKASKWLENFAPAQDELEGYIVSAVAKLDAPKKTRDLIFCLDNEFFSEVLPGRRTELRNDMLSATTASLRKLAPTIAKAVACNNKCVFGNKELLEAEATGMTVIDLFGE